MRMRAIVTLALGLILVAGTVSAASIDIFTYNSATTTTDFGSCQAAIPPFSAPGSIRVYARLGGNVPGIAGAEMFIQAINSANGQVVDLAALGWTVSVTANAAASVTVGNPILTTTPTPPEPPYKRGNIAFAVNPDGTGCQTGDAGAPPGMVLLYTIQMFNFSTGTPIPNNTYLKVGAGMPPSSTLFDCPTLNLCDTPIFTKVCVTGGSYIINPVGRSCNVAVEPTTWSTVKDLYR